MNSKLKSRLSAAAAALSLLLVAGCTGDEEAADGAEEGAATAGDDIDVDLLYEQRVDRLTENFHSIHGQAPPANVEFIRFIAPDEFGQVIAECLTEQGFDVEETSEGGIHSGNVPADQDLAYAEASYRCDVAYPVHPRFSEPLTDEQQRVYYDYFVNELVPCLVAEGYSPAEPPTFETFLETYGSTGSWRPYEAVDADTPTAWQEINETCPQSPPLADLYDMDD